MRASLFILPLLISCAQKEVSSEPSASREVAQTSCVWSAPARALPLVYPQKSGAQKAPQVSFQLEGNILKAQFEVLMDPRQINAKKKLGTNEFPYQFDVLELFVNVQSKDHLNFPYFEFEVSPYNETFQVRIENKNGKKKFIEGINLGILTSAQITATGWRATTEIDLRKLDWQGQPLDIIGNAYAILGKGSSKTYWSASLPVQKKPNFHLPEFFKPLVSCVQP